MAEFFDQDAPETGALYVELPSVDANAYARVASLYFGIVCDVTHGWTKSIVEMVGFADSFEGYAKYLEEIGYKGVTRAWN